MARELLLSALAAGLTLTGCATAAAGGTDNACNADRASPWIGKPATAAARAEIAKSTGAARIRWLYPDSVVTMDYNPARLNVTMDHNGDLIRSARCG